MYCDNCGKEVANDSKFCRYCGKKLIKEMQQEEKNQAQDEKVKVIIHRLKKYTGCIVSMSVYIDKQLVAKLSNGETKETMSTYGTHKIILDSVNGAVDEFEVSFSKEYKTIYIDVRFTAMGVKIENIKGE